nr:Fanconi anemia group I protein homolog [Leptinotarsa decemlineata]
MVSIFEKFQEYIQKRDQNGLESLMTTLNEEELQSLIKQRINTANFIEIWDYILKSFKDTSRCHEKRLCLVLYVLKEIEDKDLPPSRINTVVNRLNLELTKFKSEHLAKLCSFCLECIQSKKSTKMGWKEMLPELLNVLVDREDFTYEELDYTGQEYKTDFINTLCMSSWSPNVVTTLAAAFIDMPLNKEEHLKVVNKLGTYIEKLTAQEIPAFIYQLLRLCKQQNGRSMFLRLQNYFGVRIYSTSKVDEDSSESTMDFNAIESTSNQDTIDAESTVLFHIHSAAALGYECIKDYLNSLRNMLRSPEFVLHPFQLMTLFTISSIPHYEETVFEIVRPCIVRSYNEEQKRVHSCWFREMVPFGPKPEDVLSKVIHFRKESNGLYDAVCMNPELGIPVLDVIWFHFSEYYVMDEEQLPPLIFDKIVSVREVQAMLQEPLGKLVYAIGLIVTKVLESEEDRENNTVVKFVNILESLCRRLPNCELVHIELDDGTDLLDIMPESQKKMLILKEAMSVYEALIGYKLFSWTENSENHGKQIQNLYQGYSRLFNFSKALSKPKKGGGKKRKTDNKSQPTQADTTMKKDSQKPKVFKVPDSILGFQTLVKGLSLLHESNVTWASSSEANLLKPKKELHQHLMQATLHLVQNAKRRKDIETKVKKFYFDHISAIAAILFNRIIKRMNEFIDFDSISAVLAMECFNMILILVNTQYRSNMKQFLSKIVPQENDDGTIISQLLELVRVYQKLFEMDEDESGDDPESKKMSLIVINTLTTLSGFFPGMVNSSTIQMAEWLKNFAYNNNVTSKVSSAFSNLFFETHVKCRVSLNLLEVISVSIGETMGVLTEEDLTPETFKIINEATVHSMLLSLCSTVKSVLEDIEALIARLKSEYHLLMYPGVENLERKKENLKAKERGICCQLCFIINIMTNIVNLLVPAGNMTEAIFKNIMLLYSTLSALTKHFIMRSSKINLAFQGARFERVVKLTGKQLAPAIYKFIIHMEESEKDATQASPQKKKSVDANTLKSKVLRETRLIPKVIYEIEQFSKCVIQLSNKTKVDLNKYVGQGTVRDFRIMELDKVLEKAGGDVDTATQSTQANRSTASEEGSNEEVEEEEDEDRPPPTKRSRI